jgi:hypothetical protein
VSIWIPAFGDVFIAQTAAPPLLAARTDTATSPRDQNAGGALHVDGWVRDGFKELVDGWAHYLLQYIYIYIPFKKNYIENETNL